MKVWILCEYENTEIETSQRLVKVFSSEEKAVEYKRRTELPWVYLIREVEVE